MGLPLVCLVACHNAAGYHILLLIPQIKIVNDARVSKYALLCLYRGVVVRAPRDEAKYKYRGSKYRSTPLISRYKIYTVDSW